MWELKRASELETVKIADLCALDYEPFAVSVDSMSGYVTVWFRKGVEPDEIHSKSESIKRASRGTAAKTQG